MSNLLNVISIKDWINHGIVLLLWVRSIGEPGEEPDVVSWIITVFTFVQAPHDSTCAPLLIFETVQICSHVGFLFDSIIKWRFDAFMRSHGATLNHGPLRNHALFWLINPLIRIIDATCNWNCCVLSSMNYKDVLIAHGFSRFKITQKWLWVDEPPFFEHVGSLIWEVVLEHASIARARGVEVIMVDAEIAFKLLHECICKGNIVVASGPRAIVAESELVATVVAGTISVRHAYIRIILF